MSKGKLVAVCLIWLIIFAIGAAAWRLLVTPIKEAAQEGEQENQERLALDATSGTSPYDHLVTIALDSFSGYAVLRSDEFRNQLRLAKIKLELLDDGANYRQRLESLDKGEVQMAAFTIDALIKTSALSATSPATVVALIDETRGADAMVAYKEVVKNVDDLNHAETRFVLTPDSPSETLARVVMSTFDLGQIVDDPFTPVRDAQQVVESYENSAKNSRQVFVLWEPYVSEILANESMHVVIDSSRFTGYIVDCLVAERDFLQKKPQVVQKVVECYFRSLYGFRQASDMSELVRTDAGDSSEIDSAASQKLVQGIDWKNTQENYAHFGLNHDQQNQHLADMIDNITEVLMKTGAIETDPTGGRPTRLYYDKPLRQLFESGFHPGGQATDEVVDQDVPLPALTDQQWESLTKVGTIQVAPLVFPRGTDAITQRSERILDELMEQLNNWPQYYVIIRGNASLRGDLEANKKLAQRRAKATEAYLISHGISRRRIRALGAEPSGTTSVTFVLGQTPY